MNKEFLVLSANASADTPPIMGLVMLPAFQESELFIYHYETIGWNNSRVVLQVELMYYATLL